MWHSFVTRLGHAPHGNHPQPHPCPHPHSLPRAAPSTSLSISGLSSLAPRGMQRMWLSWRLGTWIWCWQGRVGAGRGQSAVGNQMQMSFLWPFEWINEIKRKEWADKTEVQTRKEFLNGSSTRPRPSALLLPSHSIPSVATFVHTWDHMSNWPSIGIDLRFSLSSTVFPLLSFLFVFPVANWFAVGSSIKTLFRG